MNDELFLAALSLFGAGYVSWGIRTLPRQGWQVAAAIPLTATGDGGWSGAVLTWYGILTANAHVAASATVIILLGAAHLPFRWIVLLVLIILILCVPASALVARIVEEKPATFTVGGAVFVGTLAAPWVARLVSSQSAVHEGITIHPMVILAACGIGYTMGEALGRLACLSFGCCYGRPVSGLPEPIARVLAPLSPIFSEPTRKAAYADGLQGVRLIPVQALSTLILGITSLAGLLLFLRGRHAAAFLLTLTLSQLWRTGSEFLRKDFRGGGRLSVYQLMALVLVPYGWGAIILLGDSPLIPDLSRGLSTLWGVAPLLSLQLLWLSILLYTGISRVTGATVTIHLLRHRI